MRSWDPHMTHPAVHPETPRVAVACGCVLGEGVLWDARLGRLLWVDIKGQAVWRLDPASHRHQRLEVAEPVGFVALTEDPDLVIAGFKSGLVRLDLTSGRHEPLLSPEPDKPGNRINDGHVGPDGSLYFGTMHEGETERTGAFWRWDGRELETFHEGFVVTNGPAVSHDGRTLYSVDSPGCTVYAHDLEDGVPGEARRFVHFEPGWGHPDGLAVDAEGHVWICHWGDSRVSRFAPDGTLERILPVPTALVTKCAFGGPELTTLYITTAALGRDPHLDPMAGHLYAVEAGVRGLAANVFRESPAP
jgi:sugar lactone lactonase YvrE